MLLIPGILKFDVGVNLNVFNLAIFIFCGLLFLTRRHQRVQFRGIRKVVKGYWIYILISALVASSGDISIGEYFISRKTKCSTFAKHFVPKSHLLTQFKM